MKFFDPKKKDNPVPAPNPAPNRPPVSKETFPVETSKPPVHIPVPASTPASSPQTQAPATVQIPVPSVAPQPASSQPLQQTQPASAPVQPVAVTPEPAVTPVPAPPKVESFASSPGGKALIGRSLMIKGDVTADENIVIEGSVEGTIQTSQDVIVGPEGRVQANIRATNIIVRGRVIGDVTASNRVELAPSALLQGNIRAPKLSISDNALFKGSIDMRPAGSKTEKSTRQSVLTDPVEAIQK